MKTDIYFDRYGLQEWPTPEDLAPYFLAPEGEEWFLESGNDSAIMIATGLRGTEALPEVDQVTARLYLIGNRDLGVSLHHILWDGRVRMRQSHHSKGDMSKIGRFVHSLHNDPLSVGLFIPFRAAWPAVKEFMETNGELPTSIEWVATSDLPPETFPDP